MRRRSRRSSPRFATSSSPRILLAPLRRRRRLSSRKLGGEGEALAEFAEQEPQAEDGLQRDRRDRQVPEALELHPGLKRQPDCRDAERQNARSAAEYRRPRVADRLEQARAGENDPSTDEIPGDDLQV